MLKKILCVLSVMLLLAFSNAQVLAVDADTVVAVEKAAAQGNAEAQYLLGVMYEKGRGVQQDYAKARKWWGKAAAQGYADAQCDLGFMYAEGQGVLQDYARAREWFEKAAAQGNAEAQAWLGAMYYEDRLVRRDCAKAREELGWEAEYGIDEMCADSWRWQSMNPDGYRTGEDSENA